MLKGAEVACDCAPAEGESCATSCHVVEGGCGWSVASLCAGCTVLTIKPERSLAGWGIGEATKHA